jgi:hypothetical protein
MRRMKTSAKERRLLLLSARASLFWFENLEPICLEVRLQIEEAF